MECNSARSGGAEVRGLMVHVDEEMEVRWSVVVICKDGFMGIFCSNLG